MATSGKNATVTKIVSFRYDEDKEFKVALTYTNSDGILIPDLSSKRFIEFLKGKGLKLSQNMEIFQIAKLDSKKKSMLVLKKAHWLGLHVTPGKFFIDNKAASIKRSAEVTKAIHERTKRKLN